MIERGNLLDCDLAASWPVQCGADDTVCALSDNIQDLVLGTYSHPVLAAWNAIAKRRVLTDVEAHFAGRRLALRRCMCVLGLGVVLWLFGHDDKREGEGLVVVESSNAKYL
jgi:hypothetical protein